MSAPGAPLPPLAALAPPILEWIRFHPRSLGFVHLAWLVPALLVLYIYSFYRKRMALRLFASEAVLAHLIPSVSWARQYVKCGIVLAAFLAIVAGVLRPQWGTDLQKIERRGIDLVVLLDLSKSMLAEDMPPSRIDWAKADLGELVSGLTGDRIGLVAFAGRAEIRCPLTFDYGFFRRILSELKIGSVGLGGTAVGDAILKGLECFQDNVKNHKAVLIITDGEDHESFVKEAAEKAQSRGVRVFSIGVGDSGDAKPIPITDAQGKKVFLQDKEGKIVYTKMDPTVLLQAAQITEGGYAPAYLKKAGEPGAVTTVRDIYQKISEAVEKKDLEGAKEERYQERFQWFLALAFLLLAIEPLVRTRKPAVASGEARPGPGGKAERSAGPARRGAGARAGARAAAGSAAALAFLLGFPSLGLGGDFESLLREGNRLYAEGKYPQAEEKYLQARTERQDSAEVTYNIASTYFLRNDFPKAIELYSEALQAVRERDLETRIRYNLACARARESEKFVVDLASSENLQKGVDLLREAIGGFRDVLEISPGHASAQRNLAVSQLRIKNLLDQLKRLREEAEKKAKEDQDKKKSPVDVLKELIAEEKGELELTRGARKTGAEIEKLGGYRERLAHLPEGPAALAALDALLGDPDFALGGAEASGARKLEAAGDHAGASRKVEEAGARLAKEGGEKEEARKKDLEKDRGDQEGTMAKAAGLARGLRDVAEGKPPPSPPGGAIPGQPAQGGQEPPGAGAPSPPPPEVRDRLVSIAETTESAHSKMGKALEALPVEAPKLPEAEEHQQAALELLEKALEEAEKLPQPPPPPQDPNQKKNQDAKKDQDHEKDPKKDDQEKKDQEKKDQEKKDQDKKDQGPEKKKDDQEKKAGEKKDQEKDKQDKVNREEAEQKLRKFLEKDADRRRNREKRNAVGVPGRDHLDKDW